MTKSLPKKRDMVTQQRISYARRHDHHLTKEQWGLGLDVVAVCFLKSTTAGACYENLWKEQRSINLFIHFLVEKPSDICLMHIRNNKNHLGSSCSLMTKGGELIIIYSPIYISIKKDIYACKYIHYNDVVHQDISCQVANWWGKRKEKE